MKKLLVDQLMGGGVSLALNHGTLQGLEVSGMVCQDIAYVISVKVSRSTLLEVRQGFALLVFANFLGTKDTLVDAVAEGARFCRGRCCDLCHIFLCALFDLGSLRRYGFSGAYPKKVHGIFQLIGLERHVQSVYLATSTTQLCGQVKELFDVVV